MVADEMNQEQHITELEIRVAHQDRTIDDLSDVIVEQQKRLDALNVRIGKLEGFMETASASEGAREEESPPPHY